MPKWHFADNCLYIQWKCLFLRDGVLKFLEKQERVLVVNDLTRKARSRAPERQFRDERVFILARLSVLGTLHDVYVIFCRELNLV